MFHLLLALERNIDDVVKFPVGIGIILIDRVAERKIPFIDAGGGMSGKDLYAAGVFSIDER